MGDSSPNIEDTIRRYGDPAARKFRAHRRARILLVPIIGLVVLLAVISTAHWVLEGQSSRLIANTIGIAVAICIAIGALIWWKRHWAPLVQSIRHHRRSAAGQVVLGGRIPTLDTEPSRGFGTAFSLSGRSNYVVLFSDVDGVRLRTVRRSGAEDLDIPWATIADVSRIEFVEAGVAYEGVAFSRKNDSTVLVQVLEPGHMFVDSPTGIELNEIVRQIVGSQPTQA